MLSISHRYVYHAYSEPCICLFFDVRLTIASRKTATKSMSTELPQEQWGKTPATFHSQHYAESRTNRFTFCLAPASPRIIRCNHCFGMGGILSQGSGVGIRACANARATLEVICGLSLVTTAQRFPFYFHPPETVLQCERAGFDPKSNNPALSIPFRPPGW